MNQWNYRVVKCGAKYGLFECYYNNRGTLTTRTRDPIENRLFDTREELVRELLFMVAGATRTTVSDTIFKRKSKRSTR